MKKLFTSIALIVSLAASAQKDTTITDSTALIQSRYFEYFIQQVRTKVPGLTLKEWDDLMVIANQVVNQSAAELRRKREKK